MQTEKANKFEQAHQQLRSNIIDEINDLVGSEKVEFPNPFELEAGCGDVAHSYNGYELETSVEGDVMPVGLNTVSTSDLTAILEEIELSKKEVAAS